LAAIKVGVIVAPIDPHSSPEKLKIYSTLFGDRLTAVAYSSSSMKKQT